MSRFSSHIHNPGAVETSTNIGEKSFPARQDYENYFIHRGIINSPSELWENPELVIDTQKHWHTKGQNGCAFAQIAVGRSDEIGWQYSVVSESEMEDGAGLITLIDDRIQLAVDSPTNSVISILFPSITTPEDLTHLVGCMTAVPSLYVESTIDHGDFTTIALRAPLPREIISWPVGFAPLSYMPNTRQAPVVELAIRTKVKPPVLFHRLNQSQDEAHLADVPLDLTDKVMDRIYDATVEKTQYLLGGSREARKENKFAKAKVTYTVPSALWNKY